MGCVRLMRSRPILFFQRYCYSSCMKRFLFSTVFFLMMVSALLAQESGMLQLKDGAIYYETMGEGVPVVFLHGGFGDRRMWNDQFAEFAKYYSVVRYDQRGFGKSQKPTAAYSPVSDLEMLLDHLKIDKAHLVGIQWADILQSILPFKNHPEFEALQLLLQVQVDLNRQKKKPIG